MQKRLLGKFEVSAIGLGCMGFSTGYGAIPEEKESIRLIRLAHDRGCTLFDTAEQYAAMKNEELVGKALALPGQEIPEGKLSREGVKYAVEGSLRRLRTDHIDIYYIHRFPAEIEIEELVGWFAKIMKEGKILGWGLSEVKPEIIRRAHSVLPLSAIESEYSMMARQWENNVIPLCEELNIGFMAYAPMAGGLLSGKIGAGTEFKGDDIRRTITRYSEENLRRNQPIVELVKKYAAEKGATPAQISLAWVMHKNFIVPIPGMRSEERINENLGASEVNLTNEEYNSLTEALNSMQVYGDRKDEDIAKLGAMVRNKLFGTSGVPVKGLEK